jgi:hypothetical protein
MCVSVFRPCFQFMDGSSLSMEQHLDHDDHRQYYTLTMVSTVHDNKEGFYTHTMENGDVFSVRHSLESRYKEKKKKKKKSLMNNCHIVVFLSCFSFS